MKTHPHRWIVVAAVVSVGAGAALSHVIEPGVRVEKIMPTTNTPALRIFPATPGPHPKALLAHGAGGSKEMLFRFGEAFAAAGFDCYSVDQAGHGESPQPFSITNLGLTFPELEGALGGVDVFIGHSMGGGAGAWSVYWESVGPGSSGVELDSIVKMGIFKAENALEATDSDPRFRPLLTGGATVGRPSFGEKRLIPRRWLSGFPHYGTRSI